MNNTYNPRQLIRAIREGKVCPDRAGECWNKDERKRLKNLFLNGVGLSEIALQLQRTEQAVVQQLLLNGLLTPPQNRRGKKAERQFDCRCPKCFYKECKDCPQQKEVR